MFDVASISPEQHVLIAGPTASGKSELALAIAQRQGGIVVNADALQVFDGWRILTARPDTAACARARHALYGHVPFACGYSVGQWLRDLAPFMDQRLVIVGGTGLYFHALTAGLADIPEIPAFVRTEAQTRLNAHGPAALLAEVHPQTVCRIDPSNPARVCRAWEVERATGQPLHAWHDATPAPLLPLAQVCALLIKAPKVWLDPRIAHRFERMVEAGVLAEARRNLARWDPHLAAARAIGARELIAHVRGQLTLEQARTAICLATRQYAKRQRTWFRARMRAWTTLCGADLPTAPPPSDG